MPERPGLSFPALRSALTAFVAVTLAAFVAAYLGLAVGLGSAAMLALLGAWNRDSRGPMSGLSDIGKLKTQVG